MIGREFHFHDGKKGAALTIRVFARGNTNKIDKVLNDGTVLISIKSNTKDLNKDLIKYLADKLGIVKSRFEIVAGWEGEDKLISILEIDPGLLQDLVLKSIG
jgi:uncharacterized protein YggU (UPF0235/DUF167 family)